MIFAPSSTRFGIVHVALLLTAGQVPSALGADAAVSSVEPAGFGPAPSARQRAWHEMEFYGMLHFGLNTFTDNEWGFGDESPSRFNPAAFDADQIADAAQAAGMKGLILTAKHHDGFCLWPSRYTDYSVKASPWRGGKGDVVKEVAEACRRHGLKFGVYLSPWDRNNKDYGRPAYLEFYRNQLRELLTGYGDIFTVWFDGAHGGEGFYGGAREKRQIDPRSYYEWPETWSLVRQLQPGAVMFSDVGPDVRWIGNEDGYGARTCWLTMDMTGRYPGYPNANQQAQGHRQAATWIPAECNVSIRPGWFWHATQDAQVKSLRHLVEIYYSSVGRSACLNLNIPPNQRGLIPDRDVAMLRDFGRTLRETFSTNLASGALVSASNVRGGDKRFAPEAILTPHNGSYWTTDDAVTNADLSLEFGSPVTFNVVRLREHLPLGQRVEAFVLEVWAEGRWREFFRGTSIGNQRLVRTAALTAEKVRLRITQAPACPALAEFGLYLEPISVRETRTISR